MEAEDPLLLDKCYICDKSLLISDIKAHFTTFHEQDPIKEEIKDEIIDEKNESFPEANHIIEKKFKCDLCHKIFVNRYCWSLHKNKLHYKCSYCSKTVFYKTDLESHMKKDHAEMGLTKCDICEMSFNTTTILHLHVENVHKGHSEKKFQCGICDKTFEIKIELSQHQNSVHGSDRKKLQCHICLKYFRELGTVGKHIKSVHYKQRNHICKTCDKRFAKASTLRGHMKNIHEGGYTEEEKKFKCELCPKRFVEAWILKRHIKDHETNELKL